MSRRSISTNKERIQHKSRRLAVLLVTSETSSKNDFVSIGQAKPSFNDSEFANYVELLSASNICFDIIRPENISLDTFISDNTIRYAVVIFTLPITSLTDSQISICQKVSYDLGISLIASYHNADERSKSFFGIRNLQRKRPLWPLKVKIVNWPGDSREDEVVADYGLSAGLPGIRKRGLRKLNVKQTLIKGFKLLQSLILPYIKVDLEPDAFVLSTTMKDIPLAWSYQYGKAINYYFALHKDIFLNKFNEMHRLVRSTIEANSGFGMVSIDLEGSMVLRLDDPGACSADYLRTKGILEENDWDEFGKLLKEKKIPLSVMYTPGWVDDGDKKSGALFIDDVEILKRRAGSLYNSARVKYIPSNSKNGSYDHASEFRGLKKLIEKGLVDIHSHGLTHLDTDHKRWSEAEDKNTNTQWYHEFFHVKSGKKVHKNGQLQAMVSSRDKIKEFFGKTPCALTPSGHRHDSDCDLLAHNAEYMLFSADYTGILKKNILIRNWKIPSLFLYLKDPTPFASRSGYPFVGVVHDYEIKKGLKQFKDIIEKWNTNGIRKFISMQELTASLCISIAAYYFEVKSEMNVVLTLPNHSKMAGTKLYLHLQLPKKMPLLENLLTITGATLLSVHKSVNNYTVTVLIKLKRENTISISLPLSDGLLSNMAKKLV